MCCSLTADTSPEPCLLTEGNGEDRPRFEIDKHRISRLQFCDPDYRKIKICAYTQYALQNAVTVYPVCDPGGSYRLPDGSQITAHTLDAEGIELALKISTHSTAQITLTMR